MLAYIPNMHHGRTYMPHFTGNKKELDALAAYIKNLQQTGEMLEGTQTTGVKINPNNSAVVVSKNLEAKNKERNAQIGQN